jgi:histidine ammonia-lyase/phenylalanine ammonia-lyase
MPEVVSAPRADLYAQAGAGEAELVIDGHGLTIAETVAIARNLSSARPAVRVAASARRQMNATLGLKRDLLAAGQPIYGVTAGFGDSNARQIHPDKAADLQQNLLRFLNCGSGVPASADVTRATMLVRANCLARGYSAVRPQVVELLLHCLNQDILPVIPERGSVGASGDLVPLSYVARMLIGEGTVWHNGSRKLAADALAVAGLAPLTLEAKEGLALVNGTSFMAGFAVLAVHDAVELAGVAELCTAMASQVLCGNPGHFADFLFQQKPHRGVLHSAAAVRSLLGHAPQERHDGPAPSTGYRQLSRPLQDRYSIRCAPHVIGALRDTAAWAEQVLEVEINSSNDNPLFDDATGMVLNGGNFYGSHVGQAMDSLKIAVASVGDLLDRQLELVVDEKFNNGLTPNLIPRFGPADWEAGLHHGFKGMQLTASALVAEALRWTTPATSFSRSTEAHNQDKVSMGTIAARDARSIVGLVQEVAAVHLLSLCQAADLRGLHCLSPATAAAHRLVRSLSDFVDRDRPLEADLNRTTTAIRSGELHPVLASAGG